MKCIGTLLTSFQMLGSLHFSVELEGYPDAGDTNTFLERVKGKKIRLVVEEVLP
jgi:hypothetical protein